MKLLLTLFCLIECHLLIANNFSFKDKSFKSIATSITYQLMPALLQNNLNNQNILQQFSDIQKIDPITADYVIAQVFYNAKIAWFNSFEITEHEYNQDVLLSKEFIEHLRESCCRFEELSNLILGPKVTNLQNLPTVSNIANQMLLFLENDEINFKTFDEIAKNCKQDFSTKGLICANKHKPNEPLEEYAPIFEDFCNNHTLIKSSQESIQKNDAQILALIDESLEIVKKCKQSHELFKNRINENKTKISELKKTTILDSIGKIVALPIITSHFTGLAGSYASSFFVGNISPIEKISTSRSVEITKSLKTSLGDFALNKIYEHGYQKIGALWKGIWKCAIK